MDSEAQVNDDVKTIHTNYKDIKVLYDRTEKVNHPAHYNMGQIECIDVMLEVFGLQYTLGFCICNAFKYLFRCNWKNDSPVEDIEKAVWYLSKYLELFPRTQED